MNAWRGGCDTRERGPAAAAWGPRGRPGFGPWPRIHGCSWGYGPAQPPWKLWILSLALQPEWIWAQVPGILAAG